ncbi:VanW family protein (plasmid) [Bacillus sp. 31A1R]|uniref:VanW family protein n=1 Tax=Robertmurraya mangrovi TaxID=3098077 RepID=A0ABU5IUI7_9BACI|nr:VanW family protein [Bacillus sp. 31A1R]MDZ5470803.1 VanW family protein [Bacillus sp. 31A1R]
MRNQHVTKLFLILIICTTYIFCFSHFGALAYSSILDKNDTFEENTKIGPLSVEGKTIGEVDLLLADEINKWLSETTIVIQYREKSVAYDITNFEFDIVTTIAQTNQKEQNNLIVYVDSFEHFLQSLSPSLDLSIIDIDRLTEELLLSAEVLQPGAYKFKLEEFLVKDKFNEQSIITEANLKLKAVPREIRELGEVTIEIPPNSQFSLLSYLKENKTSKLSTYSLSLLGTAIYQVILPTNFSIIERHTSLELPKYANLGFEANVNADKNKDLLFANPNDYGYSIDLLIDNTRLIVQLKGPQFLNKYTILTEGKEKYKPKTIKQYTPQLTGDKFKIVNKGKDGQLIKVYREYSDEKGEILKREFISEDFYPPIYRIESHPLVGKNPINSVDDSIENEDDTELDYEEDIETDSEDNMVEDFYEYLKDLKQKEMEEDDLWGKPNEEAK